MTTTPGVTRQTVVLLGGGIGAGKSRVASLFAEHGFEVIEADKVGHDVLEHDAGAIAAISSLWPGTASNGVIDRSALASIVFADGGSLEKLEAITHPLITETLRRHIEVATTPVVVEVPLMKVLPDGPFLRVAVVADAAIREERAVERGSIREDVRRRMSHQQTDAQWVEWSDRVIDNSSAWETTAGSVHTLIDEVLNNG